MHQHHDAAEQPRCVNCSRDIPAWDLPRYACTGCQQRTAERLHELPGLLAELPAALTVGRSAPLVGSRHGSAGSRPPINVHVIDLFDRVPAVLDSWARDWAEAGGIQRGTAGTTGGWLRWHLDWACRQHPAVDEFMREIAEVHRTVRFAATGDRGERRVTVQCGCGGLLRIGISTPGATCPSCGTRYGHTEVLALPLAARAAA